MLRYRKLKGIVNHVQGSCHRLLDADLFVQSLKDTFADKIPGEIEKIKKLRKYVAQNHTTTISTSSYIFVGSTVTRLLARSLLTKSTVVPVVSSPSSGKVQSSTLRREFVSAAGL